MVGLLITSSSSSLDRTGDENVVYFIVSSASRRRGKSKEKEIFCRNALGLREIQFECSMVNMVNLYEDIEYVWEGRAKLWFSILRGL